MTLSREQIEQKAGRALDIIGGLSNGRIKWTMRIPADVENDPDLVLAATIRELRDLALSANEQRAAGVREGLAMAAKVCDDLQLHNDVNASEADSMGFDESARYHNGAWKELKKAAAAIRSLTPVSGTVRDGGKAKLLALLKEARRAIGTHNAPDDCYATGPVTGDAHRDLVECPACSFIAMYDAAIREQQT